MTASDPITRLNAALEGRYRVEGELGEGGMAAVYLADDLKHERKVALKVLKPELAAVVGEERFMAEIKTTANLQHPHILPLFDSGAADGFLFYAMPYVEGESLRDRLAREGRLPMDDAVHLASSVAEALKAAHDKGVVHRDIKPSNILVSQGQPLVADFGIALVLNAAGGDRLTRAGASMGTLDYMSPEQATGDDSAATLYEMLAGEPPHSARTPQAVLAKRLTEPAPSVRVLRRSVSEAVDEAIRAALAPVPADRTSSMDDFRRALELSPVMATRVAGTSTTSRSWYTRPGAWLAAVLGGAVTLGGLLAVNSAMPDAEPTATAHATALRRIAVLPLDNHSPQDQAAYIASGLTDQIAGQLGMIAALQVISTTAVERLRVAGRSMDEIADELELGSVVEGSVTQSGDVLRVSVRLVSVENGDQLWSGEYDGAVGDVFEVQRDVAVSVATALNARLSEDVSRRLADLPTEDVAAYTLFERARQLDGTRPDQIELATRLLQDAIALDSTFADAYAELATLQRQAVLTGGGGGAALTLGESLARTAVRLAPDAPEGHSALGGVLHLAGRWSEARLAFLRALELSPSHPGATAGIGITLLGLGRLDEALYWGERAYRLDPTDPRNHVSVAFSLVWFEAEPHSEMWLTNALDRFPGDGNLTWLVVARDLLRGDDEAAATRSAEMIGSAPQILILRLFQHYLRDPDVLPALEGFNASGPEARTMGASGLTVRTLLGYHLLENGERGRAAALFEESVDFNLGVIERGSESWGAAYDLAAIAGVGGDVDGAFTWLERAYDMGLRTSWFLDREPMFDAIRGDSRYRGLAVRMDADLAAMKARALSPDGTSMFRDSLAGR
jgi:serine/threonine-protein kinase